MRKGGGVHPARTRKGRAAAWAAPGSRRAACRLKQGRGRSRLPGAGAVPAATASGGGGRGSGLSRSQARSSVSRLRDRGRAEPPAAAPRLRKRSGTSAGRPTGQPCPSDGRRAALPGARREARSRASRSRPPRSPALHSAQASTRVSTVPQPPLRPRGSRPPPPPPPGLFTPPGPSRRRRRRCRLLSTLAPLPIRPPPPPPPQPRLSGASSSHRTLRNRDSSRACRKLPRNCQGDEAVRTPAAFPPLTSSRSAPSATPPTPHP